MFSWSLRRSYFGRLFLYKINAFIECFGFCVSPHFPETVNEPPVFITSINNLDLVTFVSESLHIINMQLLHFCASGFLLFLYVTTTFLLLLRSSSQNNLIPVADNMFNNSVPLVSCMVCALSIVTSYLFVSKSILITIEPSDRSGFCVVYS